MARCIVRLDHDKYVEWSTVVDSPVTAVMSRQEAIEYFSQLDTEPPVSERMARADATGTSLFTRRLEGLISCNRAGEHEERLTLEQIIEAYTWTKKRRNLWPFALEG